MVEAIVKQNKILSMLFNINEDIDNEFEAQKLIYNKLADYKNEINLDGYSISVYVKNDNMRKWKSSAAIKDRFAKIFFNELNQAEELYGLTRTESSFLMQLSRYLLWGCNLVVNEEDYPVNQKELAELMGVTPKTIQMTMRSLEQKKCIIRIYENKNVYYLVNPYLMFQGARINKNIPTLFELIGYVPLKREKKEK